MHGRFWEHVVNKAGANVNLSGLRKKSFLWRIWCPGVTSQRYGSRERPWGGISPRRGADRSRQSLTQVDVGGGDLVNL